MPACSSIKTWYFVQNGKGNVLEEKAISSWSPHGVQCCCKYGLLVDVDRPLWELSTLIHKPSNIISHFFLHLSQFLALLVLWAQNQRPSWVKFPSNSCNRPNKCCISFHSFSDLNKKLRYITYSVRLYSYPWQGRFFANTWQWEPLFGSKVSLADTSLRGLRQGSKLILGPPKVILRTWCYIRQTRSRTWHINTEKQPEDQVIS